MAKKNKEIKEQLQAITEEKDVFKKDLRSEEEELP